MVVSGNKRPATDRSTSTSTTSDNDDDDPSDGGESATTTAMSTTTTTNTTTDKTTSAAKLARKRLMARLRQRRCQARKRQALLEKKGGKALIGKKRGKYKMRKQKRAPRSDIGKKRKRNEATEKQKKEIAARKEIVAAARKAIEVELRKHEEDRKAIEYERRKREADKKEREADKEEAREVKRRKREADKEEAREVKRRERVKRVNQVILKTTKTNRLGAEQLVKTVTNMVQAIHTRTRPCTDHFVFDPNPQGSTANKLIRKLRHNNGNGQYATCVFSIDEELEFNCAFAITTIGACGAPITQLIPLSEMVVYCRTNGLDELIPFFESIDTQINFANAIVQLVPKLTAVVQQGTPTPDRNIMKPVLQAFFHGLGGENNDYKPIRLQPGNTEESKRKMVSARMVTASIYLPNGKMNIVCNQMYHNQISEQARNICQRMNQSTTSREPGNITFFLDFPRQPYKVRKLAADMMKID